MLRPMVSTLVSVALCRYYLLLDCECSLASHQSTHGPEYRQAVPGKSALKRRDQQATEGVIWQQAFDARHSQTDSVFTCHTGMQPLLSRSKSHIYGSTSGAAAGSGGDEVCFFKV